MAAVSTDAEELELEMEQARARKAQEEEAAAQANAAAGLGNDGVSGSDLLGAGKSFVKGVGRGFANIPEPSDVVTAITNIPKRLENDYNAKIHPAVAGPEGWNSPPPLPVELNKNPYHLGVSENYDTDLPVDPNHPFADVAGQVAGPAIVEGLATGGASIPGAVAGVRRGIATTVGTLGGGEGGRLVDQAFGGSGETGSLFGSIIGGGFAGAPTQAIKKGVSVALTDADSAARLAAIDRLNKLLPPEQQIPVSAGLVGNKVAGQVEDATAAVPGGGGPAYKTREAQYRGLDAAAQQIAANIRGQPSAPTGISTSSVGQGVRDTATAADAAAKTAADAALDPMAARVGRSTPIDQTTQLDQMETIRRGSQPQYRGPVDTEIANLNASRTDPLNPPKVVDPAVEAQLQMQLNQAKRAQAAASNPAQTAAAQAQIDAANEQILRNRGQTFQESIESRSKTGQRVEGQQPLDAKQTLAIKTAQTDAMKQAAQLAGVTPEEFDNAFGEFGKIQDQRDLFDKLKNSIGQGEAYNQLFTGTAQQNLDRFRALREHAPDQLRQLLADQFEIKSRGAGAGLPPNPETLNTTKTFPDWWTGPKGVPPETRHFTAGTLENYDDAAALAASMRADARRPTRTAPGAGGNTLGMGSVFQQAVPAASAIAGTIAGGPVGGVLGYVAPGVLTNLAGRGLTNEKLVRGLVAARNQPWLKDASLSRILASAVGGAGPTNYAPSPLDGQ